MPDSTYDGMILLVATRHRKESVVSPPLEARLGVHCLVPPDLDTDSLGTFSGEVEREDGPLETARRKCRLALERHPGELAVASEGSFGPHPELPLVPVDEELLLFLDPANGIEIVQVERSLETNFGSATVDSWSDLEDFARRALFPSHALILRGPDGTLHKGITDPEELRDLFRRWGGGKQTLTVETDMRAHCNPSRMAVIRRAAERLAERIATPCPRCARPGFGVTEALRGLPCGSCGIPTRSVRGLLLRCACCGHFQEQPRPDGRRTEEPVHCNWCNP